MKNLKLTTEEIVDLQRGLVFAMQELDKQGDKKLSDRLDIIKDKIDQLR